MFSYPEKSEINHHTSKLIIGAIAILLAPLTYIFSPGNLVSVSSAYYADEISRNILVGFLFAISAFMFSYNGPETKTAHIKLSKVAAVVALIIALFPCKCGNHSEFIPYLHGTASFILFTILAFFCYSFYLRATSKGHREARRRAFIYQACGFAIIGTILLAATDFISRGAISGFFPRILFALEYTGLVSFGIAWLTASRHIKYITKEEERYWFIGINQKMVEND